MPDVFISYVSEDHLIVKAIAMELEHAGCSVWFYQRDLLPGLNYLLETGRAIDQAKCFLFLVSTSSIQRPSQVDKELVRALSIGTHIIPVFHGLNFRFFQKSRPDWAQAIGAIVGLELSSSIRDDISRLLTGLRALGIGKSIGDTQAEVYSSDRTDSGTIVLDSEEDSSIEETFESAVDENANAEENRPTESIPATFVHESPSTGFLADVIVAQTDSEIPERLCVAIHHKLLKPSPRILEFHVGATREPLEYYRFNSMLHGYPLILRVYWLLRLPAWSMFRRTFGVTSVPAVEVQSGNRETVCTHSSVGIIVKGEFITIVPLNTKLPDIQRKKFKTVRDGQAAISITPAVRKFDGNVQIYSKLKISVPAAPAGVAWVEFRFRTDPDGRLAITAHDPLHKMKIRDMIIVQ